MDGEVSTDFKSLNRIEISWLVQVLLNFDWFWESPTLGGGGWVDGGGGWWQGPSHTRAYTRVCTHRHIWHHRESLGFPQIWWGQPFAWNYHVYHACMCVHVRACACVHARMCAHVWGASPNHPPPPSTQPPHPQSRREPKTPKFNKSWTNRDNSILYQDSLPLNIPELI